MCFPPPPPLPLGDAAAIAAAREGHVAAVRLLIDAGADIRAADQAGRTALAVAPWASRHAVRVCRPRPVGGCFHRRCGVGFLKAAILWHGLRDKGTGMAHIFLLLALTPPLPTGRTRWAAQPPAEGGHTSVMEALLEADPAVAQPRPKTVAPLLLAAESGHARAIELLLSAGQEGCRPIAAFLRFV